MFDIGFSEIVVVAVVALIVIGPEKLPKTARTLGHLFGRLQRYVNEVKSDISREMELEELRKLQQQVQTAAQDFQSSVTSTAQEVESGVRAVESELNATATEATGNAPALAEPPPEMQPLAATATPVPAADPAPAAAANEPAAADAPTGAEPRQATLPGFDRG